jgi:hypothetical protein
MADKFWKAVERRIAKLFGTERIGAKNGNCQPDFINDWLVGEVVCHAVPKWIRAEHEQAIRRVREVKATSSLDGREYVEKLPILVIHEKGEDASTDLVVLRLSDFVDWFGSVKPGRLNEDDTI